MSKRGDRIALRQQQYTACQFLSSIRIRGINYGYCSKQEQRLYALDIWEDCKDYKPKQDIGKIKSGSFPAAKLRKAP